MRKWERDYLGQSCIQFIFRNYTDAPAPTETGLGAGLRLRYHICRAGGAIATNGQQWPHHDKTSYFAQFWSTTVPRRITLSPRTRGARAQASQLASQPASAFRYASHVHVFVFVVGRRRSEERIGARECKPLLLLLLFFPAIPGASGDLLNLKQLAFFGVKPVAGTGHARPVSRQPLALRCTFMARTGVCTTFVYRIVAPLRAAQTHVALCCTVRCTALLLFYLEGMGV